MKIAILGDTHFGCRNDLSIFYGHFKKFYEKFLDDLVEQDIHHLFQVGDLFDRRKYINFKTLNEAKSMFFSKLEERDINLYTLVGNHDAHMRESITINSPSLVLGEYEHNVNIYDKPGTVNLFGTSIDMIPWVCKDNEKEIFEFINNSKSDLCFGHFEILGFAMYKGMDSFDGIRPDIFEKYEAVVSGHYHTRSNSGNIMYVGTPYEMSWQDYNDIKGYHTFDLETREFEFIPNPDTIFVKIDYNTDESPDLSALALKDKFIKVVVTNKSNAYAFDDFMQRLYQEQPYEIKVVDDFQEFADGEIDENINLEDTFDVLTSYIDNIDTDADKDKIKNFLKGLYVEAINLEV